jgi:propanediol dehydratase small subunit
MLPIILNAAAVTSSDYMARAKFYAYTPPTTEQSRDIMSTATAIAVIAILGTILWSVKFGGSLPLPFRDRTCQGRSWRQDFPDASKHEIREFLSLFVSAFAFREKERLKFGPYDTVMAVYRALYPKRWLPDSLEVETLAGDLHKKYGVELAAVWSEQDISLGALFAYVQKNKTVS